MRLVRENDTSEWLDLLLPRRSLYILRLLKKNKKQTNYTAAAGERSIFTVVVIYDQRYNVFIGLFGATRWLKNYVLWSTVQY